MDYYHPDNLRIWALRHSYHNLHDTQFTLAMHLPSVNWPLALASVAAVAWEVTFPLAIFFKKARPWFLVLGIMFHTGTWLLMNIAFWNQIAMYVVLIDWPSIIECLRSSHSRA